MTHHEQEQSEIPEPDEEAMFLALVKAYQAQAELEDWELVLHVFTHSKDIREKDALIALEQFRAWVEEYQCARVYAQLYIDRENDIMAFEDCLLDYGEYPL